MIKKIVVATAVLGTAFTLTGCDLSNEELSSAIEQCKADEECLALINEQIDEALDERGIYPDNPSRHEMFDEGRWFMDLTDEELELLETLDALDIEFYEALEEMTDEELRALQFADMEEVLGRELTVDETNAFTLIESLFGMDEDEFDRHEKFEDKDIYQDEVSYLEYMLDRTLTTEETEAVNLVEGLFTDIVKPEKHERPDKDGLEIESHNDMIEYMLDRELTDEELAALELVDQLHNEAHDNMMIKELEYELGRELTTEELAALEIMKEVEKEFMTVFENTDLEGYDFTQARISEYEAVLNRSLTEAELEAINFIHSEDFHKPVHDMDKEHQPRKK